MAEVVNSYGRNLLPFFFHNNEWLFPLHIHWLYCPQTVPQNFAISWLWQEWALKSVPRGLKSGRGSTIPKQYTQNLEKYLNNKQNQPIKPSTLYRLVYITIFITSHTHHLFRFSNET